LLRNWKQFNYMRQTSTATTNLSLATTQQQCCQKGSTAGDAKFDKVLMANLSQQARQPMTVVSANAAYFYDRVNHEIMSLVWLVLLNGNVPATVTALICLQFFFSKEALVNQKPFFGGPSFSPYMVGLGQGNRAAPPSWIQLSSVMCMCSNN
jgi:hypothetical protein